uniref:Uncharacterized protein n=1 Tax=Romanomermis culicivorax TaxID=13658 RepID=A0A915L6V7_ROMCU
MLLKRKMTQILANGAVAVRRLATSADGKYIDESVSHELCVRGWRTAVKLVEAFIDETAKSGLPPDVASPTFNRCLKRAVAEGWLPPLEDVKTDEECLPKEPYSEKEPNNLQSGEVTVGARVQLSASED